MTDPTVLYSNRPDATLTSQEPPVKTNNPGHYVSTDLPRFLYQSL